jgi:hypothetical protein
MRITNLICLLVIVGILAAFPPSARANPPLPSQVVISVRFGPPVLPVYVQPLCPGPGFIWVPGYWAYDEDEGYYWVPGTWVLPPEAGFLWTPGYWAFEDDVYYWHEGHWGPQVGFYGGINYGYGYPGRGFSGGYWRGREFYYNQSVTNVNTTVIHNVYNTTVVNNNITNTRVSYNGGPGGANVRPTPQETAAARQRHVAPTVQQTQHIQAARSDRNLMASVNHGRPDVAATPRPGALHGPGVAPATNGGTPANNRAGGRVTNGNRGATPENRTASPRNPSANPGARPAPSRPAPTPTPAPSRPSRPDRPPSRQPAPAPGPAPRSRPAPSHPNNAPAQPSRPPAERAPRPAPEPRSATPRPAERPAPSRPAERPAPSHPQERSAPAPSHQPAAHQAPAPRQSQPQRAPSKPAHPQDNKQQHPGS